MKKVKTMAHAPVKAAAAAAAISLSMLIAVPFSAAAQASETNCAKYTGTYAKKMSKTYKGKGNIYFVMIKGMKGKIKLQVSYLGPNYSPEYTTKIKTVKVNSKKVGTFTWQDTWLNKGTGKIILKKGKVKIYMKETYHSDWNRSTLETPNNGKKCYTIKRKSKKVTLSKW